MLTSDMSTNEYFFSNIGQTSCVHSLNGCQRNIKVFVNSVVAFWVFIDFLGYIGDVWLSIIETQMLKYDEALEKNFNLPPFNIFLGFSTFIWLFSNSELFNFFFQQDGLSKINDIQKMFYRKCIFCHFPTF